MVDKITCWELVCEFMITHSDHRVDDDVVPERMWSTAWQLDEHDCYWPNNTVMDLANVAAVSPDLAKVVARTIRPRQSEDKSARLRVYYVILAALTSDTVCIIQCLREALFYDNRLCITDDIYLPDLNCLWYDKYFYEEDEKVPRLCTNQIEPLAYLYLQSAIEMGCTRIAKWLLQEGLKRWPKQGEEPSDFVAYSCKKEQCLPMWQGGFGRVHMHRYTRRMQRLCPAGGLLIAAISAKQGVLVKDVLDKVLPNGSPGRDDAWDLIQQNDLIN
jgi:hypothetical protein